MFDTITYDDGFGYNTPIHCNYINSIQVDKLKNRNLNLFFESKEEFAHMYSGGTEWYGWSANKFKILTQIINNESYTNLSNIKPESNKWRLYDVTDQISGDTVNGFITPDIMVGNAFNVSLELYDSQPIYDLNYINYPSNQNPDSLSFGDETYFFGTVRSNIRADVYTTDITIDMSMNEYNHSTNPTWSEGDDVYISEIGIYSENGDLVGIGKLNKPIKKNSEISRQIKFNIDF
jgi:hypothetical protein